jgi:hypothetical protein
MLRGYLFPVSDDANSTHCVHTPASVDVQFQPVNRRNQLPPTDSDRSVHDDCAVTENLSDGAVRVQGFCGGRLVGAHFSPSILCAAAHSNRQRPQ